MQAAPSVRRLEPRDAAAVVQIADALPAWFNAEGRASIRREVQLFDGRITEADGTPVGFVLWPRHMHGWAELAWMGVLEPFQRRGIGRLLLDAMRAAASARGLHRILVSTVADTVVYAPYERTRAFYRRCGFRDLRVDRGYFGTGDDRYDRLLLELVW